MTNEGRSESKKLEQISEGNTIQGRLVQYTDVAQSTQTARNNTAAELKQTATTNQSQLSAFGISGTGLYAVIGVVIIAIVFLIVRYIAY